jgi:hypothetical protein
LAFGQGAFVVYSSIQHRIDRNYCVGNFGFHYQRSCYQDVVYVPQIGIMKPTMMRSVEAMNLCIKMVPFNTAVQKEG